MASIRERVSADGKKSYHGKVRVRTFPPQTKSFDKLAAAKQWAALVETELRAGRYLNRIEAARHTVQDMIDKYRKEVLIPHKPRQIKDQGLHLDWWAQKMGATAPPTSHPTASASSAENWVTRFVPTARSALHPPLCVTWPRFPMF